ncbi:MAG: hypothetical protein ACT4P6_24000 [Gemmatimonadaceae bacterium]
MRIGLTLAFVALTARADAQDTLATMARVMYGDLAVIVQTRANQVRLAIDDGTSNLFLSFVGTDVQRWSDSTLRILARKRRKADDATWSSALHEPGMRAGTASLSIRPDSLGSVYTLFFADDSLMTVRGTIAAADALGFTRILRNASQHALGGRRPSRPAAVRRKPKSP